MAMFETLLIANRGEIACRIIRTAKCLGLRTIAVYSDADATAQHVIQADTAIRLGPAAARESYLNIPAILDAAKRAGVQAIHPGYGFLSENPDFADACVDAGFIFVGPTGKSMRAMGSKSAAKTLMERSRVPLLPGYHGTDQSPAILAAQAARIGYPVVIKAVAGGGGRGMRVVHAANDFAPALAAAQQEGASAFGNPVVLVEKYLQRPRHIEVQIFGDTFGNVVHLFERDCSAQRRHQKVIEEAPAPGLSPARRHTMGEAAVNAARAVNYVGAGTVEFVMDASGFYFLEMNTRLQVEHPVTEAITGYDLVEWQLRVAAGEPLPAKQADIAAKGHAIEVRVYAEDPVRDFAPSIGALSIFRMPTQDARVDAGFTQGDSVSIHYDAMLAKLIVHAPTRAEAIGKLRRALADTDIVGVAHNLDLLDRIATHPDFIAGIFDTGAIERHAATLLAPQPAPDGTILALATLGVIAQEQRDALPNAADPNSPWNATDLWWPNTTRTREFIFQDGTESYRVALSPDSTGTTIRFGDGVHGATPPTLVDGRLTTTIDRMRHGAGFAHIGEDITLRINGATWKFRLPDPAAHAEDEDTSGGRLIAPLPGQVTQVLAAEGQTVARGDVLIILEAMKTVFRLTATGPGVIAAVTCQAGDMVQDGQVLVTFAGDPT